MYGQWGKRTRFWILRGDSLSFGFEFDLMGARGESFGFGLGFDFDLMGVLLSSPRSGKLFVLESLVTEGERARLRFAGEEGMLIEFE